MPTLVVVGAQWGDEGKGKVVDWLTEGADLVVRYAGGPNAGHTLVVGGQKFIVRLVPSGILREGITCVLGQGMVVDPWQLDLEMTELVSCGVPADERVRISHRVHLILPHHKIIDGLREAGPASLGTTKRGVGPCYEDKAARRGIRACDLRDTGALAERIERLHREWEPIVSALGGQLPSVRDVESKLKSVRERLLPLLSDAPKLVDDAIVAGKKVVLEGAQGALLDVDHGTYPFVTSSSSIAGGACTGAGVGPTRIDAVVGLVKAYTTRVGHGPFPTELDDAVGERLRDRGAEFGSVTGRPRRTGWLDLPALRHAVRVNGLDGFALTKLDVLTGLDELKVCIGFDTPDGRTEQWPADALGVAKPVYAALQGWQDELDSARTLADLPQAARKYLAFIEEQVGCRCIAVSVGSARDATIPLGDPFALRKA